MEASTKRIVLLGKTGSGKSSLANTILGEELFTVKHTSKSRTSECKAETRPVHGRSITLIDTPGFFETNMSEDILKPEIVRCIVECAPGPHAFVILLKVERLSEQEKAVIKKAEEYFSDEVCKYATLVFSHGDQLQEGQKIEDFLSEDQSLMEKFAGRCHVIDNKYWDTENPEDEYRTNKFQVEQLLKSVDKIIKLNEGWFTNEMLQKVRDNIEEEKKLIRSSSENMSEEEIEEKAKQNVAKRLLKLFKDTSIEVLLGALLGVKKMVKATVKMLKSWTLYAYSKAKMGYTALRDEAGTGGEVVEGEDNSAEGGEPGEPAAAMAAEEEAGGQKNQQL